MDRFHRGLLAGVTGGVVMNLWSFFAYYVLDLNILRFLDWANVLTFGHLPKNYIEATFSLFLQLMFTGMLGVFFAFLIPQVTSKGYLLKGAFFAIMVSFVTYSIGIIYKIKYISHLQIPTVFSNYFGSIIWGLTLARTLHWLDNRVMSEDNESLNLLFGSGLLNTPARKLEGRKRLVRVKKFQDK